MDQFAKEYGFDWSIQDGEVITNPIGSIVGENESILIGASTGMIGSPTITEIGVDVTTLLNPRLLPNRPFQIVSRTGDIQIGNLFFRDVKRTEAEGLYKIEEVIFKGDSREGDWTSTAKGRIVQ